MEQLVATIKQLASAARDAAVARWRSLDPKLKYSVLSTVVSFLLLRVGIELSAEQAFLLATVVGGGVGYRVPNDGSLLRDPKALDDGNPSPEAIPNAFDPEAAPAGELELDDAEAEVEVEPDAPTAEDEPEP